MKNLKKFVALLLAGVMAMVMLTACSGGGGSSAGEVKTGEETKAVKLIGNDAKNDKELRAVAEGHLDKDYHKLDTQFKFLGYAGAFKAYTDKVGNDLAITIIARYDYKDTLLSDVLNRISNYVDTDHNANLKQDGDWTNIGIVVKGNNQQSYIGISVRIKNYYNK